MTQPIHPMLAKMATAMFAAEPNDDISDCTDYVDLARAALQALMEVDAAVWGKAAEPINTERWDEPTVEPLDVLQAMLKPLLGDEG